MITIPVTEAFSTPEEFESMTVELEQAQVDALRSVSEHLGVSVDHFVRYLINRVLINPVDDGTSLHQLVDALEGRDEHPDSNASSESTLQLLRRAVSRMEEVETPRKRRQKQGADEDAPGEAMEDGRMDADSPTMFDLMNT
ncbi:hypothetical protein CRI94_13470 [Longibacter salinarum]|uniref:Uncharacterized protein n=1 Tax=Longibacter salinarum TaxID=1850348 RepID=A0A2A8CVA3_9BACT|nr:hypothetical protein [Longibacter salinarum]PEN12531.1 hypothetical protein CRI94_13470 [Longibacter salinarum]